MKTLKQIREDYDYKFLSQVEKLPEEFMLEKIDPKLSDPSPSSRNMPVMLVFRRVSYRIFGKGQVVALYYSTLLNKYLSIPFGTGGNLNLSEAVIMDELNEDWSDVKHQSPTGGLKKSGVMAYRRENPGSKLQTAVTTKPSKLKPGSKATNRRKSFCARMGGMKKRLTSAKTARDPDSRINKALRKWNCEEDFKIRLNQLREERLEENPLLGAAANVARGVVGWAAKKALGAVGGAIANAVTSGASGGSNETSSVKSSGTGTKTKLGVKKGTSWKKTNPDITTASRQSKLAAADLSAARKSSVPQIQENKILDIRKMIEEGIDNINLNINGRQVTLNTGMAKRILEVYDSVNTKNKKIVEGMLNEDLESFKKLLNFSIRN